MYKEHFDLLSIAMIPVIGGHLNLLRVYGTLPVICETIGMKHFMTCHITRRIDLKKMFMTRFGRFMALTELYYFRVQLQ